MISVDKLILLCVQKELEIVGADITASNALAEQYKEGEKPWFQRYSFKTPEQFIKWRTYCYQLLHKMTPKGKFKNWRFEIFDMINLQYGLKYDFDYKDIPPYNKSCFI